MYLPHLLTFLEMSIDAVNRAHFATPYFVVQNLSQSNYVHVFHN